MKKFFKIFGMAIAGCGVLVLTIALFFMLIRSGVKFLSQTSLNPFKTWSVRGIEKFSPQLCSMGTTNHTLPGGEDFLKVYPFEKGDFYFEEKDMFFDSGRIVHILYLQYDSSGYKEAKQQCMDQLMLDETKLADHHGYTFIEDIARRVHYQNMNVEQGKDANFGVDQFPEQFNLFGYNDSACTLVFLGYDRGHGDQDDPYYEEYQREYELALSDFGAFIDSVYSACFAQADGIAGE